MCRKSHHYRFKRRFSSLFDRKQIYLALDEQNLCIQGRHTVYIKTSIHITIDLNEIRMNFR